MYAEGGAEAQLYVRSGEVEHEFVGALDNAFGGSGQTGSAWPVPNVVGIVRRGAATG